VIVSLFVHLFPNFILSYFERRSYMPNEIAYQKSIALVAITARVDVGHDLLVWTLEH
jgi:hypothetical protein